MNGQLYIGGKLADCDAESIALFTYRRENLDNPTVVRNSYTQQIRLKGTPANDAIFGHFWAGTRIAGSTGFDATARTPFALYTNHGEIVESGYCKLDAIERAGTGVTYLVTLYGGLGEILYNLGVDEVSGAQRTLADLNYTRPFTATVEYIEGRGAGMIDTGYVPNASTVIEVDFSHDDTDSQVPIFGNRRAGGNTGLDANGVRCVTDGNYTYGVVGYGRFGSYNSVTGAHQARHILHLEQTAATIDGLAYTLTSVAGNANTTPLVIFKGGSYQGLQINIHIRVYRFKIWDNGHLVHDFVPVRVDTVAAFWDNVTNQLYYNAGTGALYYGDDIVPEETPDQSKELTFTIGAATIYGAWESLRGAGLSDDRWKVINFPPCYEGYPSDDFDADKIIAPVDGTNLLGSSGAYSAYSGHVCVTLGCGKVSAQQVADFRCYLQRVAISVKAIFDGIDRFCTAEGWTLSLDADFFNAGNKYYADTWVLLQQLSALGYKQGDTATKAGLLGGTPSPLSFLIGYCRQFGLVITADHAAKNLNIQTRTNYYDSALAQIDLSDRVDLSQQIGTIPVTMTSRWLDFGLAGKGAFLDQYNENYRTPYGYKRIDTGYAFNNDVTDLMEGDALETVAEVAEVGIGMGEVYRIDVRPGAPPDVANVVGSSGSSYELINGTDRLTLSPGTNGLGGTVTGRRLAQLHDASYKGVDAFALVFYRGSEDLGSGECVFLTNDNATYFDALNGGRPCWHWIDDADARIAVQYVPQFGRYIYNGNDVDLSLDIYPPQVLGFTLSGDYDEDAAIFAQFWADYIGDRYDADARIATVKANIAGLPRPAELLRRFVWWDGALWSVNAVQDFDPLGDGLTTLELVRVKDPNKYRTLNL